MVEPMRAVMSRDEDEGNYKPLAFLAVVAFGVSLLFSIISVTLTIVALVTRRQLLEAWLIPLAFIGLLLSIAGRWQVQLSEGAREGRRLINIAWWMSLVGGCIYAAYFAATVMAISSQSRVFIKDNWIEAIKNKKIEDAFLMTLEPDRRKGMAAADVAKRFPDLEGFGDEPLPKIFEQSPEYSQIEILGSPEWAETPQGLDVSLNTMVHTLLGDYLVSVPARGVLSRDRGTRDWYIIRQNVSVRQVTVTAYGTFLRLLEEDATGYLKAWVAGMAGYNRVRSYLYTLPLDDDEREKRFAIFVTQGILAPALADLGVSPQGKLGNLLLASRLSRPGATIKLCVPATETFGRDLVTWDDKKHEHSADELAQSAMAIMDSHHIAPPQGKGTPDVRFEIYPPAPTWWHPQQLRASVEVEVRLPSSRARYRGQLSIVRDDSTVLSELAKLKEKEINRPRGKTIIQEQTDVVKSIATGLPHVWRISELRIDLTPIMGDKKMPNQVTQ